MNARLALPVIVMARFEFIIDTVNPKLKSYNKPLFLAFLIGFFTLAGTASLFTYMFKQCDGNRTLVVGDFEDVDIAVKEGSVGTCVYYMQMLKMQGDRLKNTKCIWTSPHEDATLCDDWGGGNQKDVLQPCETDYTPSNPYYESVVQIRYKECPDFLTTLGAAFGYMTFIELFFTGIIVFPLLSCGVIKNGKQSSQALSVKEWMEDMMASKGDAADLGGELELGK